MHVECRAHGQLMQLREFLCAGGAESLDSSMGSAASALLLHFDLPSVLEHCLLIVLIYNIIYNVQYNI